MIAKTAITTTLLLGRGAQRWSTTTPLGGAIEKSLSPFSSKCLLHTSTRLGMDDEYGGDYSSAGRRNTIINIVPQQEAWIVEQWGRYHTTLSPGFHLLVPVPVMHKIPYVHSLKEIPIEIPQQSAITLDNVQLTLDGVLYVKIVEPFKIFRHPTNNMFNMTGILQLASAMQMIPYRKYSTNAASTEQVEVKKEITIAELVKISSYQTILPFFLTIMLTLLGFFWEIGNKIDNLKERVDDKIDGMEKRMDAKIDGMEKRMDAKIEGMEKRIDGMEKRMIGVEGKLDGMEKRMIGVEGKLTEIDKKMENFCTSAMHVPSEKKEI